MTQRMSSHRQWELLVKEFLRPLKKTFPERGVFFSAQIGELLQLRALFSIESRRHFHHYPDKKIAALAPVHMNYSFTAKLKHLAALRPGRNF